MDPEPTIPFGLAEARRLQELIEVALTTSSFSDVEIFSLKLAIEETLVQAIKRGVSILPALELATNAIKRGKQGGPAE